MKCLIVDDESLARDRLRRMVQENDSLELCGEACDGREAVQQAERLRPDLVLLDIRMPGMNGIEAARYMGDLKHPPAVVFTTAYGDHALEAFDAQAVDYLLKPVRSERLQQAVQRARCLTTERLAALPGAMQKRSHICARSHGGLELIAIEDVLYFQADGKYVTVCSSGRRILVEDSLRALEEEFGDRFLRVHRNALVAVDAISALERDSNGHSQVVLRGTDQRLDVSRRLLATVRRHIRGGS